ncbi:LysR family transcriptional regulator [Achromobacter insolitus]|nr:LysR family transcriptional regulator [Achromobacter insolitus]
MCFEESTYLSAIIEISFTDLAHAITAWGQHGVRHMDLVQLRYFLKVVELRSITKAAEALHIAQPAVTRQIRQLEEELGVQLLSRHSRGAEPTAAGLQLKAGAQAMLRLAQETRTNVQASADQVVGVIRIGFPPSVGAALIARSAATFRTQYPLTSVELHEGYSTALRDALLSDKLDIAVLTDATPNPLLEITPLYEECLWVFYKPGLIRLPGRKSAAIPLEALREVPLVQPGPENTLRRLLERTAQNGGFNLTVVLQSESLSVIRSLLEYEAGAHVSPYTALEPELKAGSIEGRQIEGLWVTRSLARRVDRPMTTAQEKFMGTLRQRICELTALAAGMLRCP